MNRARLFRALSVSVLALAASVSCSTTKDTEDFVPSQRGAVQPDGGGPLLSEAAACGQLKAAESGARQALGCAAVTRECPSYIRPAGAACFQYQQASIDGCADLFDSFQSCEDFALHPCLVTAVSLCDEPNPGEGGAGGAPGGSAEAGSSGTSGAPADDAGLAGAGAGGA